MSFLDFLFGNGKVKDGREETIDTSNINLDGDFFLTVEDVFSIYGRGTVVTGKVERGSISVSDGVKIKDSMTGEIKISIVDGIEKFREKINTASTGDSVGILLRGINRGEISKGDILFLGEIE